MALGRMSRCTLVLLGTIAAAEAQSFKVQCPSFTTMHPGASAQCTIGQAYTGPTTCQAAIPQRDGSVLRLNYVHDGGGVKCQQISGGDGFATMADGTQTYLFAFGPLSGLQNIESGLPGTVGAATFNVPAQLHYPYVASDPATSNGAVGLAVDPNLFIDDGSGNNLCASGHPSSACMAGHVDARQVMDVGVMNGNEPAPLMAIDEDDEFFLTLTNVGMIMRPDLFEQHTVHFHGYPNASSFYDGVPDASVAINIGGSFTYYYLAPEAGTYFWHCHITPPEHLQMGMVGQLYVRPRQNRVPHTMTLYAGLQAQQSDPRTRCGNDILCAAPLPSGGDNGARGTFDTTGRLYAYDDGNGSTGYDVEYPLQIHGFDPNFHFVGMTFNPEGFADMKDKYFLLNGRSYPDTVTPGPMKTQTTDGAQHFSQPLPSIINIPRGGKALLRISDLDVTEYQTLASLGIPMRVVAQNARLLRDLAGDDLTYVTNSITLAGGESIDVILDASDTTRYTAGQTFVLYTPNLDHLSNDAENFGGLMTEVHILPCDVAGFDPSTKDCRGGRP